MLVGRELGSCIIIDERGTAEHLVLAWGRPREQMQTSGKRQADGAAGELLCFAGEATGASIRRLILLMR